MPILSATIHTQETNTHNDFLLVKVVPACARQRCTILRCLFRIQNIRLVKWEDGCLLAIAVAVPDLSRGWVLSADLDGSFGVVSVEGMAIAGLDPCQHQQP